MIGVACPRPGIAAFHRRHLGRGDEGIVAQPVELAAVESAPGEEQEALGIDGAADAGDAIDDQLDVVAGAHADPDRSEAAALVRQQRLLDDEVVVGAVGHDAGGVELALAQP